MLDVRDGAEVAGRTDRVRLRITHADAAGRQVVDYDNLGGTNTPIPLSGEVAGAVAGAVASAVASEMAGAAAGAEGSAIDSGDIVVRR